MTYELVIRLTLTRKSEMSLVWVYSDARQARHFASVAASKGYAVRWTESYE
jgi:hypothetical protein